VLRAGTVREPGYFWLRLEGGFQRDKTTQLSALGFVHYSHSTAAEFLDNRFSKHDWVVGLETYMRKRAESNYAMMLAMGNKNARKREIRKPKKQTPKQAPQRRDVNQIVTHNVKQPTGGG
jgi:hypothetical protein